MTNANFVNQTNEIFHVTNVKNLGGIFEYGLQNHYTAHKQSDISNQDANSRREAIEPIYHHKIHDYTPFYFNPRNAMLYAVQNKYDVVILGISVKAITNSEKYLVSNKNASKNSAKFSKNLHDLLDLSFIDFNEVCADRWCHNGERDENTKATMMAEILLYPTVPSDFIKSIYVKDSNQSRTIHTQLQNLGLADKINVIIDPKKFF